MGRIKAICISEKKGTQKTEVPEAELIVDYGIKGDAHAGKWHRQVSLLGYEKIEAFKEKGAQVDNGAFGENLIVEGFDLRNTPVGTRFQIGDALLELTQIGKECHSHCAIYHAVGDCIMPKEHENMLASCYKSCLEIADENGVDSIAFCCISTGVFMFPNDRAAEIAVQTVKEYKEKTNSSIKVIFNVFKDQDEEIYKELLR